ncbi:MAG: ABC transporter ATP-binding protein [Candidatus Thorarchaeota archaeon]
MNSHWITFRSEESHLFLATAMIEIDNLSKKFGDLTAVDAISMDINEGEVFGFLGPNGAGKTTTVRMLCCLISKTSGTARISGYEIGDKKDSLKIRKMIGLVPDNVGLSEHLSAYDNLDFYGKIYDLPKDQREENIKRFLEMLGIWEKRKVTVGTFSKGMKQKLAIARALIHDPQVLFMDEPTSNLDPEAAKTVRDFILDLKKQKKTIFLNTHNLDEAQRICDRIGILNTKLVTIGTPDELEDAVRGRKTVIELEQVTDSVLKTVQKLSLTNLDVEGNTITFDAIDSSSKNWPIVEAIVHAGGRVNIVKVVGSTLEEVYLKLVGENQ